MYILIVTGLSGAGKSNALSVLENMGYVCADNMPCQLVKQYIDLCVKNEPRITRIALVIDSRESVFGYNPLSTFEELDALPYPYEIMFLECSSDILLRRYNETRRRHPMHDDVSVGIAMERDILAPLKEKANYIIDTTNMKSREFHRTVEEILSRSGIIPFRLIISSFGYKRGVPKNADIVFDMRYTKNPFYDDNLRALSGKDKPVRDFVLSDEIVRSQLEQITLMLSELIPAFMEQGKRRLMVSFGCTGGRHRSVVMAEALHDRMKGVCSTLLEHRDLVLEADDIKERFGD